MSTVNTVVLRNPSTLQAGQRRGARVTGVGRSLNQEWRLAIRKENGAKGSAKVVVDDSSIHLTVYPTAWEIIEDGKAVAKHPSPIHNCSMSSRHKIR